MSLTRSAANEQASPRSMPSRGSPNRLGGVHEWVLGPGTRHSDNINAQLLYELLTVDGVNRPLPRETAILVLLAVYYGGGRDDVAKLLRKVLTTTQQDWVIELGLVLVQSWTKNKFRRYHFTARRPTCTFMFLMHTST